MFDLEQQIHAWRRALAGSLGGRAEAIEELESHLREEVQRLVGAGQALEQAWPLALHRLGSPQQLAVEFGKLPALPSAWLPARLVLLALGILGALLAWRLLAALVQGEAQPLLASHIFAVTMGYTAMFAVGALAAWSLLARALRGWDERRAATLRYYTLGLTLAGLGLTAMGVVLGAWWARDHLGRFWGWDVREVGGLAVLAWYGVMLACSRWSISGWVTGMLVGVAGNIVVSLSWFGTALVAPLHAYGYHGYAACLAGFIMGQLLILLLALVPPGWFIGQQRP